MPRFTGNLTTPRCATSWLRHLDHPAPEQRRGIGLGGLGPVGEGFVGLLFGVGILALICFWIGDRAK